MNDVDFKGFTITENKGFRLNFANGWAISVQWGRVNYCGRRQFGWQPETEDGATSEDAEVAVFDPRGGFHRWDDSMGDDVMGYLTPDEVASLVFKVANYK